MTKYSVILISFALFILSSCKKVGNPVQLSEGDIIADTITYPVRIKNIDPDDVWADTRLVKLNRKKLVDDIFESVYSGKATAYNYLTDEPISIEKVKEIEQKEEFSRDNIVELEFKEKWFYDSNVVIFKKEVISILVAYAVFEDDGKLRSLKAAFYIKNGTNSTKN